MPHSLSLLTLHANKVSVEFSLKWLKLQQVDPLFCHFVFDSFIIILSLSFHPSPAIDMYIVHSKAKKYKSWFATQKSLSMDYKMHPWWHLRENLSHKALVETLITIWYFTFNCAICSVFTCSEPLAVSSSVESKINVVCI